MPGNRLTRAPSQVEVVTLAVYLLGGARRAVDTEDVAVEAHRLAPGRFCWKKHPEQINLELIRVFLSDAKKSDAKNKRALVIGSGRTGWRLTQQGLKWAQQASAAIGKVDPSRTRAESRSGSIDEQRWRRERDRIRSTSAWQLWESGGRSIPVADAKVVFRIDSYARGEIREAKLTRLRAMFSDDVELTPFLDHLIEDLNREATR
jgi:hypothetical protein